MLRHVSYNHYTSFPSPFLLPLLSSLPSPSPLFPSFSLSSTLFLLPLLSSHLLSLPFLLPSPPLSSFSLSSPLLSILFYNISLENSLQVILFSITARYLGIIGIIYWLASSMIEGRLPLTQFYWAVCLVCRHQVVYMDSCTVVLKID